MTRSKTCFKCNETKSIDDFYAHDRMIDGHLNKCKACTRNDVLQNRLRNIERIRQYDRERAKNKDRAKAAAEVSKRWRSEDKRRVAAHNAVARAIRKGTIVRMPCERCGNPKSYAHHENYDEKLNVMWLCQPHHKERHKELVIMGITP